MSAEERARVKLITLLNVSSQRRQIKRKAGEDWHEVARKVKLQKSKAAIPDGRNEDLAAEANGESTSNGVAGADVGEDDETEATASTDPYKRHFATEPELLTKEALAAVTEGNWKTTRSHNARLGRVAISKLEEQNSGSDDLTPVLNTRLQAKFESYTKRLSSAILPAELMRLIGNYTDLFHARMQLDEQDSFRATATAHAMNHIQKTRTRILKNNEALAHASVSKGGTDASERETRDQGFTRPKVLILVPFRNTALEWMRHIKTFALASQIENSARFDKDFSLPDGAVDKLASNEIDTEGYPKYPPDHRDNFKGNIDDTFRVGIKITRKSLKLYSEFYQSDLIIASPLGLRTSIEKDRNADFLSSIEIMVADKLDVLQMQNWEHVQFVFDHLNQIPKEAHGADFSRVKPWYLDGNAGKLRQTILLSAYDTPEMRHLYSKALANVAGKIRTEAQYDGVLSRIQPGVKQTFTRFHAPSLQGEDEARFEHFTTKTLPAIRKSAVASSNTIIFIPSYFDFVRVRAYFKTLDDVSYSVLSEYSSNSEVSRARSNFFSGKISFLLITERFHFYRRYKIRGARTIVFYALPDHPEFYAEYLQYPFLKRSVSAASKNAPLAEDAEVMLEANEVACQVDFSRFDMLRLERIVGTVDARRMCDPSEGERFSFV